MLRLTPPGSTRSSQRSTLTPWIFLAIALSTTAAPAATITYSGLVPFTTHYLDGGVDPIPADSSFTFQLGTFTTSAGFSAPSAANVAQWESHWRPVEDAGGTPLPGASTPFTTYVTAFGPTDGFTSDLILNHNSAPFTTSDQGYIWGYNSKDLGSGTAQWILMTNSTTWMFPFGGDPPIDNPTWSTGNANSLETVVGSLSGSSMTLELITAPPVPEPAPVLLLAAGAGFALLRRSRDRP